MKLTGLDHIGIPTNDMEKSEAFYSELGFECVGKYDLGGRFFAFYQLADVTIELIPAAEIPGTEGAVSHFAIGCDNIDEVYAFCKEKGYTILGDGIAAPPFWANGEKCFNILGPNDEKIEFCQRL